MGSTNQFLEINEFDQTIESMLMTDVSYFLSGIIMTLEHNIFSSKKSKIL